MKAFFVVNARNWRLKIPINTAEMIDCISEIDSDKGQYKFHKNNFLCELLIARMVNVKNTLMLKKNLKLLIENNISVSDHK